VEGSSNEDRRGRGRGRRGRRTTPKKTDGDVAVGLLLAEPPPRVAGHPCDRDEAVTEMTKAKLEKRIEGGRRRRGGGERLLKRFRCANDTMINNHPSPMKGRGQVYSNEEQFAFPL
jgi:hypothetical protein